jgi:lysophospholipase L1-like esterase
MGHGYAYLIAARLGVDRPEQKLRFLNRGCSGHRVDDLYARWKEDTIRHSPDIVSILIGVNDTGADLASNAGDSSEKYEKIYRQMLKETVAALPQVRFVLGEPFVLPVGGVKDRWNDWKSGVDRRREIVARLAKEFDAILVRNQKAFEDACAHASPEYWIWDGVHPMPAGHEVLARAWLAAVGADKKSVRSRRPK